MDVVVEDETPISKSLRVTLDADDISRAVAKELTRLGSRAKIPGFRPGKIPPKVLRQRFGTKARIDAIERSVQQAMNDLLRGKEMEGVARFSRPKLVTGVEEGEPVVFTITTEWIPKLELDGYKGMEVPVLRVVVSDEDIDTAMKAMQAEHTVNVPVEDRDTVEAGDIVIVDYVGVGEGEVTELRAETQEIDLESPGLPDGFAGGLVGATKGELKTIQVTLPEGFGLESIAGTEVELEVTVHEIKRAEVPELDDAFAAEVGEFDTLEELRASVRARLEAERRDKADADGRERMIGLLVEKFPTELPPMVVRDQAQTIAQRQLKQFTDYGLDPASIGLTAEQLVKGATSEAERSVHVSAILMAVVAAEGLAVTDEEVEAEIVRRAESVQQPAAKIRAQLAAPEAMAQFRDMLLTRRVLDFLWDNVARVEVDSLPEPAESEVTAPEVDTDEAPEAVEVDES